MSTTTRHQQLLAAGWIYDASQDRYTAPGSPTGGTAKQYNLDAAWRQFQADQLDSASTPDAPQPRTRQADPRRQEPQ